MLVSSKTTVVYTVVNEAHGRHMSLFRFKPLTLSWVGRCFSLILRSASCSLDKEAEEESDQRSRVCARLAV